MREKKYLPRLVAYVNVGNLNEQERDEQLAEWVRWISYEKLDARVYEYGYERGANYLDGLNGSAILAVKFNGTDIDKIASALDMTAGDLLSHDFALGMGE
jgi:hypothetical protein